VSILSNFSGRNSQDSDNGIILRLARKEEYAASLRLILADGRVPATGEKVLDFLQLAVERRMDLSRLCVACQASKIIWAILPLYHPGRTALLIVPPQAPDGHRESIARDLISFVVKQGMDDGVQMEQVLIDPSDRVTHRLFTASGFRQLAELVYLHRLVQGAVSFPQLPMGMHWVTYSSDHHKLFAQGILNSYVDSLDCPALNGKRRIDDIIAGHKAAGEHDPEIWQVLVGDNHQPHAVLLLSRTTRAESLELIYLGVSPESRGHGLGDVLMRQALATVARREMSKLTLAVDAKNAPALKLYYRHGLHRLASRIAMLREMN